MGWPTEGAHDLDIYPTATEKSGGLPFGFGLGLRVYFTPRRPPAHYGRPVLQLSRIMLVVLVLCMTVAG